MPPTDLGRNNDNPNTPSLPFQLFSHLLLSPFSSFLLVPMDHKPQSSGLVALHSRKQYKLDGADKIEVEGATIANDPHDKYENQEELVRVPERLHLGYFSTV